MIDRHYLKKQSRTHWIQTLLYLLTLVLILCTLAFTLLGQAGLWSVLALLLIFFLVAPEVSPHFVLRFYQASPLPEWMSPELYQMVRGLAHRAGLAQAPEIYVIPQFSLNALSTGSKKRPSILLSHGLLRTLSQREMMGVLAHELGHIAYGDIKLMLFSQTIGRLIHFFSFFTFFLLILNLPLVLIGLVRIPIWLILLVGLSPTMITLIQLKISRTREYSADLQAVQLTEDPEGLARALEKIGGIHRSFFPVLRTEMRNHIPEWLNTHPPTEKRIERLRNYQKNWV